MIIRTNKLYLTDRDHRFTGAYFSTIKHNTRLQFLDTLRFIAACAVLFQHIAEKQSDYGKLIVSMLSPGVFGVVLFFLISGFVIPMTAKGSPFKPTNFLVKRIFRIYPLVLFAFLLLAISSISDDLIETGSASKQPTIRDWIANLLLIQDYVGARPLLGVTWTLSIEIFWYILFAISYIYLGYKYYDRLIIAFPIVILFLAAAAMILGVRIPIARIGMVYAAVLGCRTYQYFEGMIKLRQILADLTFFIVAMTIANVVSFGYFRHPNITMNQAVFPWITASVIFLCLLIVPNLRESVILNNRITSWLGSVSYSIYLLHPIAMEAAVRLFKNAQFTIASISLTAVLSILGYYLVERPGQNIGRRLLASRIKNTLPLSVMKS